jgi:hypothetical protein
VRHYYLSLRIYSPLRALVLLLLREGTSPDDLGLLIVPRPL